MLQDKYRYGFTHGGKFHADDVFSAALLKILFKDIEIQRGNEVPINYIGIVFDIGLGKYDHHQNPIPIRNNGVQFAAFGLLWCDFGELVLSKKEADEFDREFIQPLDINDNTGISNSISDIIETFNPTWDSKQEIQKAFDDAVDFAKIILEKQFSYIKSKTLANEYIKERIGYSKDGILILEKHVPFKHVHLYPEIKYVIYPSIRGGFSIHATNDKYYFYHNWRGRSKEELIKISGIPSLYFCHRSGFLCVTYTLEDAIWVCDKNLSILQKAKNKVKRIPRQ